MPKKTTNKKSTHKTIVKKPKVLTADQKQRKKPVYKSFRLQKRIKHPAPRLPSWWVLVKKSGKLMLANKRQIGVFFLLYLLLNILLVRGFGSPVDVVGLEEFLSGIFDESSKNLGTSLTIFGVLLETGAGAESQVAQIYQVVLLVVGSLSLIWLYRQQQAGSNVTMKQAFYKGMFPLIPFVLVSLVMVLQLLPMFISSFLFQIALSSDLIVNSFEVVAWLVFVMLTVLLSFYMLVSSTIGLYIVTLPEMTPMQSLREAKELVRLRRLSIVLKMLALGIFIILFLFIVTVPVIYFVPEIAEWLFFGLTIMLLPFIHGYMFSLYRELL